jgi:hypothetical protein
MPRELRQCSSCSRIFATVADFDFHRAGSYDQPGQRRCLNVEGLEPFVCGAGIWRLQKAMSPICEREERKVSA